ncbi:2369_t:CDS:2, partial [Gigaspora rosea]
AGLSVKVIATCYLCQAKIFYGNEMPGIEFSDIIAATGLVGEVNHEEWSTIAAEDSANNALCAACEEVVLKGNEILEVGFDCAWSKVRKAPQASAKFIYNGIPEGFQYKPIVAFNVVEKPCVYKRNNKEVIVNEGNYNNVGVDGNSEVYLLIFVPNLVRFVT